MTEDQAEPMTGEESPTPSPRKPWERPELAVLNAAEAENPVGWARKLLAS